MIQRHAHVSLFVRKRVAKDRRKHSTEWNVIELRWAAKHLDTVLERAARFHVRVDVLTYQRDDPYRRTAIVEPTRQIDSA